jgi:hypothetical protein
MSGNHSIGNVGPHAPAWRLVEAPPPPARTVPVTVLVIVFLLALVVVAVTA